MCGITGVWQRGAQGEVTEATVIQMADQLVHRGPDDAGQCQLEGLALAHQRLSIIDLSKAGRQPMTTADGRFTLVFNGEIYNYRELRDEYLQGISFRSETDSEVLLYLLAEKGIEALSLVRGMFALALWDSKEEELLLARDPFGKKPLYYAEYNGLFLFGSEVKALLAHPEMVGQVDRAAAVKHFLYEYVPAPASGWRGIRQLPMGSYATITRDGVEIKQHWQPQFTPKLKLTEAAAQEKLDELLAQAVERRMIADVPVGLFLSGGLDSTTIGWYMREQAKGPVHSFSVSFDEASFDESGFARQAAEHLGCEHHVIDFTLETFKEALEELVKLIDIPFADASLVPMYVLSREARKHITVALDGDGSDELFAGYGTFQAAEIAEQLRWLPRWTVGVLQELIQLWPAQLTDFSWEFKAKSFLRGLSYSLPYRNQIWLGAFTDRELQELLTDEWRMGSAQLFGDIDDLKPQLQELSTLDQVSLLTLSHYLHNGILTKLDRATMYTSLEARTPFLDSDLADFAMRLPDAMKRDKYLLKRLMRDRIPSEIIDRPKKGFGIPLGLWLKGPLYDWADEVLATEKLRQSGVLEPAYVRKLLHEHRAGKADHRKKLWTLLTWQLWWDRYSVESSSGIVN